ncbi:oxidoreductase [Pseudonocardia kunmingensis]|uniref:Hemoglobin n=1 Tax=Pseudonocardia kunmingensis TaxID=630975 RepID=A0A543DXF4_9PSEU|nr:oxidoreductase [Pseudonocardia kunmingensis]TQM13939.1 hemoglobin [Pseudonocardia kunmingensis]
MTLYDEIGGFDVLLAVCRRWHELCLTDPVSAHPFERPMHPRHDERLAAYLAEAFGGPHLYTGGYGDESSMMRLHAGNGEHAELDGICLAFFDQALADAGVAGATAARVAGYFRAATLAQHAYRESPDQVPDGLPFPLA